MELVRRINWVDIIVIIILLRTSYASFQNGLTHEIFSLLGLVLNITISLHCYSKIGTSISRNLVGIPLHISKFICFIILMLIIWIAFRFFRIFLSRVIRIEWSPFIESTFGMVVGVARASLVASLVLIVIALTPVPYMQWSLRDRSLTGLFFLRIGPTIYEKLVRILPAVKTRERSVDRDILIEVLASDKSLAAK